MKADSPGSAPDGRTTRNPKPRGWTSTWPVTVRGAMGWSMDPRILAGGDESFPLAPPGRRERGTDLPRRTLVPLEPRRAFLLEPLPAHARRPEGFESGAGRGRRGGLLHVAPGPASVPGAERVRGGVLLRRRVRQPDRAPLGIRPRHLLQPQI